MARKNRLFAKFANSTRVDETGTVDASLSISAELTGSGGMTSVATLADIPLANNSAGDQVFVEATDQLFIWNGTGWYNIALINTAPSITAGGAGSYELASDGTPTVITLTAEDPDGLPVTWSYSVTSGSLEDTTVTNVDNVFTITPGSTAATFNLTFTASDGINTATDTNTFTLSFAADWTSTTVQTIQSLDIGDYDAFGTSVAIQENVALIGARRENVNRGALYVFTKSGSTWTQQQKIPAPANVEGDNFGWSVAIDGDTAIVGAYAEDDVPFDNKGAAYIFTTSDGGSTWTQQQRLAASDGANGDYFGYSVAISGDTAVVGSTENDTSGAGAGCVYVFTRSGTTWTQQQKIQSTDIESNDEFGRSVAIDGDRLVVGAYFEDTGQSNAGAAYVFTRSGSTWTQQQKLQASNITASASFGQSVAIDNSTNTILVGARNADGAVADTGAAYVFVTADGGSTWTQQQLIYAAGTSQFGWACDLDGDTIIVGAYLEDGGDTDAGAAYIFTRDGSTWTETSRLVSSNPTASGNFGYSVSISGGNAIVGARSENIGGPETGTAYIFAAG